MCCPLKGRSQRPARRALRCHPRSQSKRPLTRRLTRPLRGPLHVCSIQMCIHGPPIIRAASRSCQGPADRSLRSTARGPASESAEGPDPSRPMPAPSGVSVAWIGREPIDRTADRHRGSGRRLALIRTHSTAERPVRRRMDHGCSTGATRAARSRDEPRGRRDATCRTGCGPGQRRSGPGSCVAIRRPAAPVPGSGCPADPGPP